MALSGRVLFAAGFGALGTNPELHLLPFLLTSLREAVLLKIKNISNCDVSARIRRDRFLPPVHKVIIIILLKPMHSFLSVQPFTHTDQQYLIC